ncbi:MAG TPA: hypothetical protein VFI27_02895 [candidate division Zixibacteria bacterium]|nr:hypothetical protein [candidate division Zixibacteria bacterium]
MRGQLRSRFRKIQPGVRFGSWLLLLMMVFVACSKQKAPSEEHPTVEITEDRAPAVTTSNVNDLPLFPQAVEPGRYQRHSAPIIPRSSNDETTFLDDATGLRSGSFQVEYDEGRFLISAGAGDTALALTLPGGDELNLLDDDPSIVTRETDDGEEIVLTGQNEWAQFQATIYTYHRHPGLFRWRLEIIRHADPPARPEPELQFIEQGTGQETSGQLEVYADHVPMAAPHYYAYSEALDSTLFYWVDLTALNPFMTAARFSPAATPVRRGQQLGHSFTRQDLERLGPVSAVAIYDSYLYLEPGRPPDEAVMFNRYLANLGDIYDLIAVPDNPLPDWFGFSEWDGKGVPGDGQGIHSQTLADLAEPANWVEHDGQRYVRAYVSDSRGTAEAISQLDVYNALDRYYRRFAEKPGYMDELRAAIPDFFNPDIGPSGMFQNSGPLSLTGAQGRGDTWYEVGHALKVAELALWNPADSELRELAIRSGDTWIEFAQAVDYQFPQFYSFDTWEGTGREPDAGGGFAYFMLLLHEITNDSRYLDEARSALLALEGHGFRLSYETHMTAITAAAAARLFELERDPAYLGIINQALANLLRLSWLWERDVNFAVESTEDSNGLLVNLEDELSRQRTFFGLNPTQVSAVITPKEQYETSIYLTEVLQRLHGDLDPTVEKLMAEFVSHTLQLIPSSLPPYLPAEEMTDSPAAYETVAKNDLALHIPLEDLRDIWELSGSIGQEIYGAGMAPTLAAQSLIEVRPGVVIYSGYPLARMAGQLITFAGSPGTYTPVAVLGVYRILDENSREVDTVPCGSAICFQAEGGASYLLDWIE